MSSNRHLTDGSLKNITLSREELLELAEKLAQVHIKTKLGKTKTLHHRVKENMEFLRRAYKEITEYVNKYDDLVPAAEWFLDNFYRFSDMNETVKKNLPKSYEKLLISLGEGEYAGYPRVYSLLAELVKYSDSQLTEKTLKEYINAYQKHISLSSGEIWAIPIFLKIILVEKICSLVEEIISTQEQREKANQWLVPFIQLFNENSFDENRIDDLLKQSKEYEPYSSTFVELLARKVRELGPDGGPILEWLETAVQKQGTTVDELVKTEHQRQAACQVTMGHAIKSMQFLNAQDWPLFFEEISSVERTLQNDPSGIYGKMDFDSRDAYRHQIEKMARRIGVSELFVAQYLIKKAQASFDPQRPEKGHIGYYLFGKEKLELQREICKEYGIKIWPKFSEWVVKYPQACYFGSIIIGVLILLGLLIAIVRPLNLRNTLLILFLASVPVSTLAISTVNVILSHLIKPTFLPKLDFTKGIPAECKTMVVIPTLLSSPERVKELFEQLEVFYLVNQDENLHFALLGDFVDADAPEKPEDDKIIETAIEQVNLLQQKYGNKAFYFFHRRRQWNSSEHVWMGWERKRGKLIEFNRLLLGSENTSYYIKVGDLSILPQITYVITLDADTQLPRDGASKLIGTIAHPLQAPVISEDGKKVIHGYGVLQPRMSVSIMSAEASSFARLFSGNVGIDPYTKAISDIYQDLFGEGIFTGKGIYHVKVFHQMTGDKFPENIILSHDLIEGLYARTGLVTDIEFYDGYPAKYFTYMNRLHRWIRGDWQLLRYLKAPLSWHGKWKIFDNLRRSLEAPSQFILLCLGMAALPGSPWLWFSIVLLSLIWPILLGALPRSLKREKRKSSQSNLKEGLLQAGWQLLVLPHQGYKALDGIVRSLYRQFISHQKLLEWQTAEESEKKTEINLTVSYLQMAPGWGFAVVWAILLYLINSKGQLLFAFLTLLWLIGPYFAYRLSLPSKIKTKALSDLEEKNLRLLARRIWAFFEEYVNDEEHCLPPDNVQIDPPNGVAHRTSPTNIGLAMLANLSAWEFGYVTPSFVVNQTEKTLLTIEKLEKWKGHLYNWYDTQTLKPLHPLYVSTVDSGNLVVYWLTLQSGLKELKNSSVFDLRNIRGLKDTFELLAEYLNDEEKEDFMRFELELEKLETEPFSFSGFKTLLNQWNELLETTFEEYSLQNEEGQYWFKRFSNMIRMFNNELKQAQDNAPNEALIQKIEELEEKLYEMAMNTEFTPLYDEQRGLFSIGYKVEEGKLDSSYYDLLASEARQASYIAIAKGEIPQSHWFRLGRSLTQVEGKRSLVSWSGTMFEFLMPLIIMKNFPRTLLNETYQSVVYIQQKYGERLGIPWGISESGFYAFDTQLNYQYKAFGVPGLGLKRGLVQDRVIAPYATFLALMVNPKQACENLFRLKDNFLGRFGLYEAIEYTPERLRYDEKYRIVKSYMAHHQGMSLLSLSNVLHDNSMQRRFHDQVLVQGSELLLQERIPNVRVETLPREKTPWIKGQNGSGIIEKNFVSLDSPHTLVPVVHLIGNGKYSVMLNNAGSGYSRYNDLSITRWRDDGIMDHWGMYFYIQNLNSGEFWSATYQPCQKEGDSYKMTCAPDRIEFYRKDGNIGTRTEVVVSPEDQVEIRRITLTNYSQHVRELEITSYLEVVLAKQNEDIAHPAFSKLFIQTEFNKHALIAYRRPRYEGQEVYYLMHALAVEGEAVGAIQYETDRLRFIGRKRSLSDPQALELHRPLTNTVGAVLDPIMSLRQRVKIGPGQSVKVAFSTGIGRSRESILALAEKYGDPYVVQRAFELAWTHSQMELRHFNLSSEEANMAARLAGQLIYVNPKRKEVANIIQSNRLGQSGLWKFGISGDLPIVLVKVEKGEHLHFVKQLMTVHEYWRSKGLYADLVILNQDQSGYVQTLHDLIQDVVRVGHRRSLINQPGGIFILQEIHLKQEDIVLLHSAAKEIFDAKDGSWAVQMRRKSRAIQSLDADLLNIKNKKSQLQQENKSNPIVHFNKEQLIYFNGLGGFTPDGKEYVIQLTKGMNTPLPWINVLTNPKFGTLVSESGGSYTWSLNSRENKLTPWSNDPVLDFTGEALYLRDEDNGEFWSPTPYPVREDNYQVCHGQGYTRFIHISHDLKQEVTVFVPLDQSFKVVQLDIQNLSPKKRELSATYYLEWVLGTSRDYTAPYIVTEIDHEHQLIYARNVYQEEFRGRIAYLHAFGGTISGYTGNRREFIGRNCDLSKPLAMLQSEPLSNSVGAGFESCGVIRLSFSLEGGETKKLYFIVGEEESIEQVRQKVRVYGQPNAIQAALNEMKAFWDQLLGSLQVKTPEPSFDILINRWLLYQTLGCRIWARSAFYQSGGAYGFRDQLQDVMSLVGIAPHYARRQIILHAGHQFVEGDVQHWWHQEENKGIRTKFSDDLLWLPYVTAHYLEWTEDYALLNEKVNYLEDELLGEDVDERYNKPKVSSEKGTIYDHCVRAIERSLRFGDHGLPLIGTGDWNDGFSRVGRKGKGESVWLGWFMYTILESFIPICLLMGDEERANRYAQIKEELKFNLERHGWDGGWYRRAYFDDGTPMGSADNQECQIDAIAQSWAVLSGAAKESRASDAMLALERHLWKKDDSMLLLLTPPFDQALPDPGYIRGYVPGVRENGGQYTHGAIWAVLAYVKLGDGEKAWELFQHLNPINHTRTLNEVNRYKVEPYVMAADVYATSQHMGRGGWTWYTGAAGWMYQAGVNGILGFKISKGHLLLSPCIPYHWEGYELTYRYKSTIYKIRVENPSHRQTGIKSAVFDGQPLTVDKQVKIQLVDDGAEHQLKVVMG